ncbi:efflux RND transporter periplasmic adaptor subunit [Roseibium aggregatum]|uniref:Efflux RND transporter periplasmic adaptor subunit n=1 Tax=Roseibium aggregatum TaxID=187304 RepID=A0A939EE00_9HYPH|nr:efflux RND transporter periplasmic adaptor subunit [Roseibium aggregatum]MBN9670075.1 efflux RND transporter periplasmic adaptor subunit [Roseibium aggregatum]
MMVFRNAPFARWTGVLLAASLLAACQESGPDPFAEAEAKLHAEPRPAKIFEVSDQIGMIERRFAGRVAAVQTVDLSFQVPGKLLELPVLESQQVKKGDVIARLDTTDYDRAVRQATINLDQARRELDRLETLRDRSVISQSAYDEQKNTYDLAAESLKEARQNLEYTTLRAPFDGIVSVRLIDNFTTVSVATPVVRVHDLSEVQVDINVAEALFGRVTASEVASIEAKFPAYADRLFPLEYREHSSQVDEVTQTYRITLAMPREGVEQLFPGMTASVIVKLQPHGLALGERFLVPSAAVVADGNGKAFVWKYEEGSGEGGGPGIGKVTRQPVEIDTVMGDFIPVASGLESGDEIVSAGAAYLSDGQTVRRMN